VHGRSFVTNGALLLVTAEGSAIQSGQKQRVPVFDESTTDVVFGAHARRGKMVNLNACVCGLVVGVCTGCGVPADDKASSTKMAATPEEAVQFLVTASQAGDLNGYLAQTTEPTRSELVWTLEVPLAEERLEAALKKKLGPRKPASPGKDLFVPLPYTLPTVHESLKSMRSIRILSKKGAGEDQVELSVWETHRPNDRPDMHIQRRLTAVKTEKGWKLRFTVFGLWKFAGKEKDPDGKLVEVFNEELPAANKRAEEDLHKWVLKAPRWIAVIDGLTRDAQAGKFNSYKDADTAIIKVKDDFREANGLPRLGAPTIER
jgi:hypothetical protein